MSSSKVMFNLETLQAKALASVDERIDAAVRKVEVLADDQALQDEIVTWRARQEARVSDLFRELGSADNQRLSTFKIEPIPEREEFDLRRAERDLDRLIAERSRIVAKTESLVADDAGNISLTKTQLSEFFGL